MWWLSITRKKFRPKTNSARISLGPLILRSETAALAGLGVLAAAWNTG